MAAEQVRMRRPADEDRILLMAGQTTHYAIEPRGEYVRDPSRPHAGGAFDARPWTARLMIVEVAGLAQIASDEEVSVLADVAFPEPVISDPRLTGDFLALHTALETPATRLERDERLAEWLRALIDRSPAARPR